jgi:glycine oxidase
MAVDYRTDGTLLIGFDPEEAARLEHAASILSSQKLPGQLLNTEEARRLEPGLSEGICSALLLPGDHHLNNRQLTQATLVAAQKRGVVLREGVAVESIIVERRRAVAVRTSAERLTASKIVIAAGCWSATLGSECARLAPTRPVRGQMLALRLTEPCPAFGATCLNYVIRGPAYLVPRRDGRVVVGSTVEDVGFDKSTTAEALANLRASAERIVPAFREANVAETWAGLRPDSPDHLPILGTGDIENLFFATGHFRNGILLAPITARVMTDLILRGSSSTPIEGFSPLRFRP